MPPTWCGEHIILSIFSINLVQHFVLKCTVLSGEAAELGQNSSNSHSPDVSAAALQNIPPPANWNFSWKTSLRPRLVLFIDVKIWLKEVRWRSVRPSTEQFWNIFSNHIVTIHREGSKSVAVPRIQDFPERGVSTPERGANLLFGQFSPKTAWKWRNFGSEGGVRLSPPPVQIRQWSGYFN